MAIKGKKRTKTRQPVRAPRRGPVPVPVPFAKRRGVQALAAFIAGLLVFWGGIWLTNGLREQDRTTRTEAQDLLRRRAASSWKTLVETEVGTIGQVQEGTPPVILPQLPAILTGLKDRTPKDVVATLQDAARRRERGLGNDRVLRPLGLRSGTRDSTRPRCCSSWGPETSWSARSTSLGRRRSSVSPPRASTSPIGAPSSHGRSRCSRRPRSRSARFQIHHSQALSAAGINVQPTLPGA